MERLIRNYGNMGGVGRSELIVIGETVVLWMISSFKLATCCRNMVSAVAFSSRIYSSSKC